MNEPRPQTDARGSGGGKPPRPPVLCADDGGPGRREYEQFRRAVEVWRLKPQSRPKS